MAHHHLMASDEVPVTLEGLKVLASKARFDILQCLEGQRHTASEISEALDTPRGTVHSHLEKLVNGGFVEREDDNSRLWVYYSLTPSGDALAQSDRPRLVVLLSASAGMFVGGVASIAYYVTLPRPVPIPPRNATPPDGGPVQGPTFTLQDPHLWLLVVSVALLMSGALLLLYIKGPATDREDDR